MIEILRTKLFIPRPRSNRVTRPRLVDRLNSGLGRKLSMISAPAGFGKTTLLSEWIPHSPRCVTWLSLDDGDNDPTKFWTYFIASIQQLQPQLGENALALLQSPQSPAIQSILTLLINDLVAFQDVFAAVLDDYHAINSQPIHEALIFFIDHLPANMNLVIATRIDPPLPLPRLRAQDQMTELRANDLRFTADEAAAFLEKAMALHLSTAEVAALEARTEGWIAGLQIAALSMQGRSDISEFIRAFSGSHRHILGYLAEEALDRQPAGLLNFLLQTSILDRLCGPLCDAVTGDTGGQSVLERLDHDNLFISPLDDQGQWYRYHQLFAEVLRLRLQRTQDARIPELHRRARLWLERNDLVHDAVNHAIAGEDFNQAARLIEQVVGVKWQAGEIKTLQAWMAAMPAAYWQAHPRLWLVQSWVAMTVGDFAEGDANLRQAEQALDAQDEETARQIRPEAAAMRACHASLVQDAHAVPLARQALSELPAEHWLHGMLVVFLGAAYYTAGDLNAAFATLEQAAGFSMAGPQLQPHRVHLLALGGTVRGAMGRLNEAMALLYKAVELAEPGGVPIPYIGTLFAYMSIGPVLVERNELEQAELYMTRCLEMAIDFGSAEVQIYALSLLAVACLAHDDLASALKHFEQVDSLLLTNTFSSSILASVEYRRFQMYLRQGNLAAAQAWVDAHGDQAGPLNAYAFHRIAPPQLRIARGSFAAAAGQLAAIIQESEASGHGAMLVKALVLQALAASGGGRHAEALSALDRALRLAEPQGFVRSFVDEGEPLRRLLLDYQALLQQQISGSTDVGALRLLAYTDQLLAGFSNAAQAVKPGSAAIFEPLSERELDILRLIATGRSNQEIAALLVIAVSTVKSHINSLYGKLGTSRRTEAIAIARDLGILSE